MYSIDWPPGFKSRLADPLDPLYVGEEQRAKALSDEQKLALSRIVTPLGKAYAPVYRYRPGSVFHTCYQALMSQELGSRDLARICGCSVESIWSSLSPAVKAGALIRRALGKRRIVYALGDTPIAPVN